MILFFISHRDAYCFLILEWLLSVMRLGCFLHCQLVTTHSHRGEPGGCLAAALNLPDTATPWGPLKCWCLLPTPRNSDVIHLQHGKDTEIFFLCSILSDFCVQPRWECIKRTHNISIEKERRGVDAGCLCGTFALRRELMSQKTFQMEPEQVRTCSLLLKGCL